jgi:hypothetical protein
LSRRRRIFFKYKEGAATVYATAKAKEPSQLIHQVISSVPHSSTLRSVILVSGLACEEDNLQRQPPQWRVEGRGSDEGREREGGGVITKACCTGGVSVEKGSKYVRQDDFLELLGHSARYWSFGTTLDDRVTPLW